RKLVRGSLVAVLEHGGQAFAQGFERVALDAQLPCDWRVIDPLARRLPMRGDHQYAELGQPRRQAPLEPRVETKLLPSAQELGAVQPDEERSMHLLAWPCDDFVPRRFLLGRQFVIRQLR